MNPTPRMGNPPTVSHLLYPSPLAPALTELHGPRHEATREACFQAHRTPGKPTLKRTSRYYRAPHAKRTNSVSPGHFSYAGARQRLPRYKSRPDQTEPNRTLSTSNQGLLHAFLSTAKGASTDEPLTLNLGRVNPYQNPLENPTSRYKSEMPNTIPPYPYPRFPPAPLSPLHGASILRHNHEERRHSSKTPTVP